MPRFIVRVRRNETYEAEVEREAESALAAEAAVDAILSTEGWDAVFPGDDGEYEECWSEVVEVRPADDADDAGEPEGEDVEGAG